MGNMVLPVLHITLEIVFKMFSVLVEHVKSQYSVWNEPTNDESNKKWRKKSEELLGRETKFKRLCQLTIKQSQKMKVMKNLMKLQNS